MKEESIVGFGLRCKTVLCKTCIHLLVLWVPVLRVRRVADYSIHSKWFVDIATFLVERPVLFEGISTTSDDVLRNDTTHDKVHTGKVIGILLEFLGIILHAICTLDMLANGFTNSDEQRTGTRSRVIDLKGIFVLMVLRYYLRHNLSHFVRCIELACLLASTSSKVANKELIYITEHIVIL